MMSFLMKGIVMICNILKKQIKTSLQAYPHICKSCYKSELFIPQKKVKIIHKLKRISLFFFRRHCGSMTIEASLAVPIFIFFIVNLLSLILVFQEYTDNLSGLHQEAKELSVLAHVAEYEKINSSELVILTKVQKIKPIVPIISFPEAKIIVNCRIRKWTGYNVVKSCSDSKVEEWVYITKYGSVYHRSRSCSYLNPSIHCCNLNEINVMRNNNGEKYYKCEMCGNNSGLGVIYITEQGNKYHKSLNCSGLKRIISTIPISQVGNRSECKRCEVNNK